MANSTCRVKLPAISRRAVYSALGYPSGKLPADMQGTFPNVQLLDTRGNPVLEPVTLHVLVSGGLPHPPDADRDRLHRIHVNCPNCGNRVPFGNLPSHYTTKLCVRIREIKAAMVVPASGGMEYRAGKTTNGIMLVTFYDTGFSVMEFGLDLRIGFSINCHYVNCPRYSMFYALPQAFADCVAEGEDTAIDARLRKHAVSLAEFAGNSRELSENAYLQLERFVSDGRRYVHPETPEQRREQLKAIREERKQSAVLLRSLLESEYAWLL